jgi:predicted flap endonuclease-1-like 5' DNA nuclease
MAKALKKTIEKELEKAKGKSTELLHDINEKVTTTKQELQKQLDELTTEVKKLRKDPSKQAKKLIKKVEKKYEKQLKKIQQEFDDRLEALLDAKNKIIAQLEDELASRFPSKFPAKAEVPAEVSASNDEPVEKKAVKKAPAKKGDSTKESKPAKSDLSAIKGVGPKTVEKLAAAGFSSLEDIVDPAKADALQAFSKVRGFNTWKEQAAELLGR